MVCNYWASAKLNGLLTVMVPPRFIKSHSKFIETLASTENAGIEIVILTGDYEGIEDQSIIGVKGLIRANRVHRDALLEAVTINPNHVICMYYDHAQLAVRMLHRALSAAGITVSGILFRAPIFESEHGLQSRLRNFRKRLIMKYCLGTPSVKSIFCLDPLATSHINALVQRDIATWLPDGTEFAEPRQDSAATRFEFEIEPSQTILLFFGFLSRRKGAFQALQAFANLEDKLRHRTVLILAGQLDPSEANDLQTAISSAREYGRVITITEFVEDSRMTELFDACDIVLAPYQQHIGSSGILIRAAKASKPVIGSDFGMLGRNINSNTLGMAVDCTDIKCLSSAIEQTIANPQQHFDRSLATNFAASNTPEKFSQTLLSTVECVHGCMHSMSNSDNLSAHE